MIKNHVSEEKDNDLWLINCCYVGQRFDYRANDVKVFIILFTTKSFSI